MENNYVLNIERAQALLDFIKINCEEDSVLLNKVTLEIDEDHPGFGYSPEEKLICLSSEPLKGAQDSFIIDYMNEEFNLGLKNNTLTRAIHAFLHELGHHVEMGNMTEDELVIHLMEYREYDFEVKMQTHINMEKIVGVTDDMQYYIEEVNDDGIRIDVFFERMDELTKQYDKLRKERIEIDKMYRMNPVERFADTFAAKIIDNYLRKSMPQLFEEREHVIR